MVDGTSSSMTPQGWTSSPDSRGTVDILWACASTTFLCTWSVLCVNIGPPKEKFWRGEFARKLFLASACVLAPEFVQYLAIGQWESACRSVQDFSKRYPQWSMKHSFFADMGGFILETRDGVSWPLDAKELWYLIEEDWIKEPMISSQILLDKSIVDDKNKADKVIRVIACVQALWFVSNCIGRACQRLTSTTLELTTLSVIVTAVAAQFFWAHKPADVRVPYVLKIEATVQQIRGRAGFTAAHQWYETPLEFVHREKSYALVLWDYYLNILRRLHLLPAHKTGIIDRRRDDNFPFVSLQSNVLSAIVGTISYGVNFIPWNFWFPSTIERNMWRVSAFLLFGWAICAWTYHMVLTLCFSDLRERSCRQFALDEIDSKSRPQGMTSTKANVATKRTRWMHILRNMSPDKNPAMTLPLRVVLPAVPLTALYIVARCYVVVEDLIAFRALPPNSYRTVDWSNYLPHIG